MLPEQLRTAKIETLFYKDQYCPIDNIIDVRRISRVTRPEGLTKKSLNLSPYQSVCTSRLMGIYQCAQKRSSHVI